MSKLSRKLIFATCALIACFALPLDARAAQPGIQTHLLWGDLDKAAVERQLDQVRAAGATVVRVDAGWASLQQSGPSTYESWFVDRLDHMVNAANARGLKPIVTLMESPCWASMAPETLKQSCAGTWWTRGVQKYGPTDPGAYAKAAAWVAARYRTKLAGLELWNEPNHPEFFKGDDRLGRYAALVRAAYPAIKAVAPDVTVVAGAISESDDAFINGLYDRGIKGFFDAFSIHPYNANAAPGDPRTGWPVKGSFLRGVPAVRNLMLAKGDDKPLWLTEFGWSTSTVRSDPWLSGVDEATQARYLEEQAAIVATWSYVHVNIWFNLKDTSGTNQADLVGNYGLLDETNRAKPAYAAFQRSAPKLLAAPVSGTTTGTSGGTTSGTTTGTTSGTTSGTTTGTTSGTTSGTTTGTTSGTTTGTTSGTTTGTTSGTTTGTTSGTTAGTTSGTTTDTTTGTTSGTTTDTTSGTTTGTTTGTTSGTTTTTTKTRGKKPRTTIASSLSRVTVYSTTRKARRGKAKRAVKRTSRAVVRSKARGRKARRA